MPAKSEAQRRLMAAALACKTGKGSCKGEAERLARELTEYQLRAFMKRKTDKK